MVAWNSSTPATPAVMTIDSVTCTLKLSQTPVGAIGGETGSPPILWNDFVLNAGNAAPAAKIYEVLIYKSIPATDAQTSLISAGVIRWPGKHEVKPHVSSMDRSRC